MKAVWIATSNLRRMFRVRTNIFFVFVFPMVLILVLGATFGGSSNPRLGVVGGQSGPLARELAGQLEGTPHIVVVSVADPARLLTQVERGNLAAGLVIPADYDAAVRSGVAVTLRYMGRPDKSAQQLAETVQGAVSKQATVLGAARFAVAENAASSFTSALDTATQASTKISSVSVRKTTAGTALFPNRLGQFDVGAQHSCFSLCS